LFVPARLDSIGSISGLQVGHYGDGEVKKHGWLHDSEGEAESASEWMGDTMGRADDWVTKHSGSAVLGKGAAALTGLGTLLPAGAMALGGAAVGGYDAATGLGHAVGDKVANRHRANHYSRYEGIDHIGGGAQSMANYDDAKRAAVERANQQRNAKYWQGVRENIRADPDLGFFEAAGQQNRKDAAASRKK
jgi:hypothetical protein